MKVTEKNGRARLSIGNRCAMESRQGNAPSLRFGGRARLSIGNRCAMESRYRRVVCVLLFLSVVALVACGIVAYRNRTDLPGQVESSVSVAERKKVYLGGTPIGIYLETDGVFVVDTGAIVCQDGSTCCPAENILQSGDYIQAVNQEEVNTKEKLVACITACDGDTLTLDVNRQGEQITLQIEPVQDEDGVYKAGIWVRNDTQGIGTLTWVDEEGYFGALGHGISDVDTSVRLNIHSGTLYAAEILSVVKGTAGSPGELSGIIHYSDSYRIGIIEENSEAGIYGRITGFSLAVQDQTLYETAFRQEVETGTASILCTVDGTRRDYEIQIREVRQNSNDVNKSMVIEVTDPELLELTGGIVQGMSGSPIVQNGRLVGAVTHVFVADSTKGYGIFIENMMDD